MIHEKYSIPYQDISYPKLFVDYCKPNGIANKLFEGSPLQLHSHLDRTLQQRKHSQQERSTLAQSLLKQYHENTIAHYPKIKHNIEALTCSETYTVIGGQQCGLLGGPMFVLYKIATIISLSDFLNKTRKGYFVPVFWIASEDHDWYEVNQCKFRTNIGDIASFTLSMFPEHSLLPISDIHIPASIWGKLKMDIKKMQNWSVEFNFAFPQNSNATTTLNKEFFKIATHFFGEKGLICVEPDSLRCQEIDLNMSLIQNHTIIQNKIAKSTKNVHNFGYQPILNLQQQRGLLFRKNLKNKRLKLFYVNHAWQCKSYEKNCTRTWTCKELLLDIQDNPHLFSHNVISRPFVQDQIFPNAVSICGKSEIQYMAQIKGLYDTFGVSMPILFPRLSYSFISSHTEQTLKKFNISIQELQSKYSINKAYSKLKKQILKTLPIKQNAKSIVQQITCELQNMQMLSLETKRALERIQKAYQLFEDCIIKNNEQTCQFRQNIAHANNEIFPMGKMQEQILNMFSLPLHFDKNFQNILFCEDITKAPFQHQLIVV